MLILWESWRSVCCCSKQLWNWAQTHTRTSFGLLIAWLSEIWLLVLDQWHFKDFSKGAGAAHVGCITGWRASCQSSYIPERLFTLDELAAEATLKAVKKNKSSSDNQSFLLRYNFIHRRDGVADLVSVRRNTFWCPKHCCPGTLVSLCIMSSFGTFPQQ